MEPPCTSSDCYCFLGLFGLLIFFVYFCWGSGSSVLLCLWPMWGTCIFNALNRCCSSSCNKVGFGHMVVALWYKVPATLYLDGILWWLSHCRYKLVWFGFLNTDVFKLPSYAGVIKISSNSIDPSSFSSSQVNFILGWMEFRCCRRLFLFFFLIISCGLLSLCFCLDRKSLSIISFPFI